MQRKGCLDTLLFLPHPSHTCPTKSTTFYPRASHSHAQPLCKQTFLLNILSIHIPSAYSSTWSLVYRLYRSTFAITARALQVPYAISLSLKTYLAILHLHTSCSSTKLPSLENIMLALRTVILLSSHSLSFSLLLPAWSASHQGTCALLQMSLTSNSALRIEQPPIPATRPPRSEIDPVPSNLPTRGRFLTILE